jgi:phage tail-like protein
MAKTGQRKDPHLATTFHVEIDGVDRASFRRCTGLKSETEIFEYQEGGDNEAVQKLVGQTRYGNIILSQGYTSDSALFDWRNEIQTGDGADIKRRNGSIVLYDDDNKTEVGRYNFEKAWPVRWEMSDLDSSGQAAVVTLELAVSRVTKAK